jgi:hypothetical protein
MCQNTGKFEKTTPAPFLMCQNVIQPTLMETDYLIQPNIHANLLHENLLEHPLVNKEKSLTFLPLSDDRLLSRNIFFGTGLSNPINLTIGIPLDFLVFPLMANKVCKIYGYKAVFHFIADKHSSINGFSSEAIKNMAKRYQRKVEDIVDLLGIDNYHVVRASSFSEDRLYEQLITTARNSGIEDMYAINEAADIEYFRVNRSTDLKISWSLEGNNAKKDETYFDRIYEGIFGQTLKSLYLKPGKRLDDKRVNATPYTVWNSDKHLRFIIDKGEDTEKKIRDASCSEHTKLSIEIHYKNVLNLFESTVGNRSFTGINTWQRLNSLIDFLCSETL